VILMITKQGDANVIETVDRIREMLPEIERWIPADIKISIMSDRTQTIRASVRDMQYTLAGTIALVMLVVFLFLRRVAATLAAGVTVPLSLAGTCAGMWFAGFSVDNLSLMALAIAVGFVVDDAIVMLENAFRNIQNGRSPLRATLEGARQIGFTVVAISISLIAAFIPLLFMGGVVGRLFREFSVTLTLAIAISAVMSLSVTPMICAYFVKAGPSRDATWLDRLMEGALGRMIAFYDRTLGVVLQHRTLTLIVLLATIALTVDLYVRTPKSFFPQDDTGLIFGGTQASPDVSFKTMVELQQRVTDIVLADPAVLYAGSSVAGGMGGSVNRGTVFISLKPLEERGGLSSARVVDRLRGKLSQVPGIRLFMVPVQDMRIGARQSQSQYQYTLYTTDLAELSTWMPRVVEKIRAIPGIVDVNTDRDQSGLQANVVIDRTRTAQLGIEIQDINNALNNAFSQRQISTLYTQRNQYRVILEIDPQYQRDPNDLSRIYVPTKSGSQIPLSTIAHVERGIAPLTVNHQGTFPAATVSYNLTPGMPLETASRAITQAIAELHMPDTLRGEFAGEARAAAQDAGSQPLLILAAIVAVYIVLGVLYESLAHPLTIISTLPAAGLGALLALRTFGADLSVIGFIGIILLIGIVKKNGIMLVDFALDMERHGLPPTEAIRRACLERFRPILMTTLASLLGAVPLLIASGPGSELRRPLGITIIGGLLVSQILTLYTTPVIYLLLDRLHRRIGGGEWLSHLRPRHPEGPYDRRLGAT
ncbi:MAG: efflux RND transporter permease subunit, partial [Pseudorhodoplanes sp.]